MQGTCINSENTVYFITELSMAALMHTSLKLQDILWQLGCSSHWWKRHSELYQGMGGELVQPPWAAESKGRQNEWQNEYFKWKKFIFSTLQILYYWAKYKEIKKMQFF